MAPLGNHSWKRRLSLPTLASNARLFAHPESLCVTHAHTDRACLEQGYAQTWRIATPTDRSLPSLYYITSLSRCRVASLSFKRSVIQIASLEPQLQSNSHTCADAMAIVGQCFRYGEGARLHRETRLPQGPRTMPRSSSLTLSVSEPPNPHLTSPPNPATPDVQSPGLKSGTIGRRRESINADTFKPSRLSVIPYSPFSRHRSKSPLFAHKNPSTATLETPRAKDQFDESAYRPVARPQSPSSSLASLGLSAAVDSASLTSGESCHTFFGHGRPLTFLRQYT